MAEGVIYVNFQPSCATVNAQYLMMYTDTKEDTEESSYSITLTSTYCSKFEKSDFGNDGMGNLKLSPLQSVLIPSDYHLNVSMMVHMGGQKFKIHELKLDVMNWLFGLSICFLATGNLCIAIVMVKSV